MDKMTVALTTVGFMIGFMTFVYKLIEREAKKNDIWKEAQRIKRQEEAK